MDLIKEILELVNNPAFLRGLQLFGALIVAMILMQGVKAVIKEIWPESWSPKFRTWAIFCTAYIIGFQAGAYFIEGEYIHKWAAFIGFSNPIIYYSLTQWAKAKNKLVLLSVLKMRPIVRNKKTGEMSLCDTQTFMVKNNNG